MISHGNEIREFQKNCNSIIINLSNNVIELENSFNGIVINTLEIYNNINLKIFDYTMYYESVLLKIEDFEKCINKIKEDNVQINALVGKRGKIDISEYNNGIRIKGQNNKINLINQHNV